MSSPAVLSGPARTTSAPTTPAAVAAALAAASDRWLSRVQYLPLSRWTALLETSDAEGLLHPGLHDDLAGVQIWLLSWLPGQGTVLHDHGSSAGAFAVVRGTLTERVVAGGPAGVHETTAGLGVGQVRRFGTHYVHQVTNEDAGPAVSVHVYTPALRAMNAYDLRDDRLVHIGTERAGVDW